MVTSREKKAPAEGAKWRGRSGRHRRTLCMRVGAFLTTIFFVTLARRFANSGRTAEASGVGGRRLRAVFNTSLVDRSTSLRDKGAAAELEWAQSGRGLFFSGDTSAVATMRRRLKVVTPCTTTCEVKTGGPISITGAISGQCDCATPCGPKTETCCGSIDNGGGVLLYLLVTLFTFLGLAIVCDSYFCESLAMISARLGLSDDVAGATFMAVGSSAPELFTAIVTTLITGGTEGIGTIVGSAIFNIMMIVGVTCIFAGQQLEIWWYPLSRDAVVYVVAILMMYVVLLDKQVSLGESLVLMSGYIAYVLLMVFNAPIVRRVQAWEQQRKEARDMAVQREQYPGATDEELRKLMFRERSKSAVVRERGQIAKELNEALGMNPMLMPVYRVGVDYEKSKVRATNRVALRTIGAATNTLLIVKRAKVRFIRLLGSRKAGKPAERILHTVFPMSNVFDLPGEVALVVGHFGVHALYPGAQRNEMPLCEWPWAKLRNWEVSNADAGRGRLMIHVVDVGNLTFETPDHTSLKILERQLRTWKPGTWATKTKTDSIPLTMAEASDSTTGTADEGGESCVMRYVSMPLECAFRWTIPDCSQKEHLYMVTFSMSIFWIGILSFVMVDFAGRMGCVLGVPPLVMGLVVLAAGTSVPDALSSILVARNGQGDMAVANVLGSNIFNIFMGLGVPWFVKVMADGVALKMPADKLELSIVIMLLYTIFFMSVIVVYRFTLSPAVGYTFFGGYLMYLTWTLLTMLDPAVIKI